jgi:hypothetical protein
MDDCKVDFLGFDKAHVVENDIFEEVGSVESLLIDEDPCLMLSDFIVILEPELVLA